MKNLSRYLSAAACFTLAMLFSSCNAEDRDETSGRLDGNYDQFYDNSGIAGSGADPSGEGYNEFVENAFISTSDEPVSTFSIDADGASYSNVRRFLKDNQLPPQYAVRTEEIINFFQYDYAEPSGEHPISLEGELSDCPWTPGHRLLRIGIKGRHLEAFPACNFVFLVDVSGSMSSSGKLDLLKDAFTIFADQLRPQDRIAIVTYAGEAGVLLPATAGDQTLTIKNAVATLGAGGSTNGAGGIHKAYEIAEANFIEGGNNRVILGTDGDFNVGVSDQDGLVSLIEEKRESGVFLSILGVGTGNLQDGKMEQLADNGNGTYEYLDDPEQAEKVFVHEFGKFFTVAKDVKIQLKFNPNVVKKYRLIGYENRLLNEEDFEDDTKDAGEIGADQTITAIYELEMAQQPSFNATALTVDFRYKQPDSDLSVPLSLEIPAEWTLLGQSSENHRLAVAAAGYGMMLFGSQHKGSLSWDDLLSWANDAQTFDPHGWRSEFVGWVQKAKDLQ